MKRLIILTAILLCGTVGYAQISEFIPGNNDMQILTTKKTPEGYTGSPYVEKDFTQGVIVDADGKTKLAYLRYNTVEDVVEIKMNKTDEDVFVLPKVKNLSYTLNNYTYVLDSFRSAEGGRMEGYFIHYYDGENIDLYGRPLPDVTEAQMARTGYGKDKPAHLSVKMEYFLSVDNKPLQEVKLKKRDFKKALPQSQLVDQYFSNNKVRSVEDYKEMLGWYSNQT